MRAVRQCSYSSAIQDHKRSEIDFEIVKYIRICLIRLSYNERGSTSDLYIICFMLQGFPLQPSHPTITATAHRVAEEIITLYDFKFPS